MIATATRLLGAIDRPADLKDLSMVQLTQLAVEVREELVTSVTKTGGHLASNLGVVELTIGLHRVCLLYTSPSPRDRQKSRMPSSA